ncbi:hypothetical protein AYO21_03743 [Fonsecaea monophora]|uniref:Major facilitator superfamily (MFS) profile domain-containing protein n=1 Tax=Fonsecaea monophora TaxID=254056 RepID=A0A177FCY4_9EURO|nr:hypothetical protein AYO21_03743 [Fonsecaea monophora]OAG42008.1 hypothetical protein AYO21_03743 [Fonsecaea monophora]
MTHKASYLGLRGKRLTTALIVMVVCPAYILIGYNNAAAGGLLTLPSFVETFPRIDTVNTAGKQQADNARIQGTVVALYTVGCMFGSLLCLKLGDKLGRLRTIMIGAVIEVVGAIIMCTSFSLGQLIVSRVVLGFGFGAISATVPVWQSECSPAEHRGALVVLEGMFASCGLALSQWVELGFFFTRGSVSWRFPWAFPIVLALWILAACVFLPDSPRWMVKKGRIAEATTILAILEDLPEDSPDVQTSIHEMQKSLAEMDQGSLLGLFHNNGDRLLNRTFLACFSTFSQQMNGAGVIGFYTTTIFEQYVGLSALTSRILSGSVYTWQIACSFLTIYTVDRFGRRPLMLLGAVGMGAVFIILAGTVGHAADSRACSIISALCVFLYGFFFTVGALGVNYLYGTEVAPLAYRVPIYSLTSTTLWSINFLVVEITPIGFTNLGNKFFIIFAVTNLCIILPVVYFFFPETRRHSLEAIDAVFKGANSPFDVVRRAKKIPSDVVRRVDAIHMVEGGMADERSASPEMQESQSEKAVYQMVEKTT